jgi:hypothetical protein
MTDALLPWEDDGAGRRAGICLSGGGLRAAAFSLGAVQALQQDRGLLFGERSADLLAVVSGGSYLGAASMINADRLRRSATNGAPPLAQGTPEAEHVISHGNYLKNWGTASKIALGGLMNFAAFAALFAWSAVMLSALITTVGELGITYPSDTGLRLATAVAFVVGARLTLRGMYLDGGAGRVLLPSAGGALLLLTAPSALTTMRDAAPLSDATWWTSGSRWLLALAASAALIGLSVGLSLVWRNGPPTRLVSWFSARLPALIGGVLFCLVATGVAGPMDRALAADATASDVLHAFAIFFGGLIGAAVLQIVARTSLHGMYRDSLATCFSVARAGDCVERVAPTACKLSDLAPPAASSVSSFPRLLVCATANVVWDPAHPGRSPLFRPLSRKRRKYASFVYSHDRCGLPGVPGASFATTDLERLQTRAGISAGREPLVSLMTAVASTGAAISPAMGRRTSEVLRPAIALSNVRLGRWLPNPLSARIRRDVEHADADKRMRRKNGIGGSYDEFVPELFGLHHSDAPRVYISDGGHYDNLGLLALLQARCAEIWCVDAEADSEGKAGQLRDAISLAETELGVRIDVDLAVFPGPAAGMLGQTHVSGDIVYRDGTRGRLVVIKLGLTPESDEALRSYRLEDKGFPYHGTFWPPLRVMWYGTRRFDHYRRVGHANTLRASRGEPTGLRGSLAG